MRCDEVINGEAGAKGPPAELRCSLGELPGASNGSSKAEEAGPEATKRPKPKAYISWVPAEGAVRAEVRLYSHMFLVDSPDDRWEEQVRVTRGDFALAHPCDQLRPQAPF